MALLNKPLQALKYASKVHGSFFDCDELKADMLKHQEEFYAASRQAELCERDPSCTLEQLQVYNQKVRDETDALADAQARYDKLGCGDEAELIG